MMKNISDIELMMEYERERKKAIKVFSFDETDENLAMPYMDRMLGRVRSGSYRKPKPKIDKRAKVKTARKQRSRAR